MKNKTKLEFNNRAIRNHKATFISSSGKFKFEIKQCTHRLFEICKEHQDEKGHWIKNPNLTVSFTQVN